MTADVDRAQVRARLRLEPAERLTRAGADARAAAPDAAAVFDPVRVLAALHRRGVAFLVIGGLAGAAHGSPRPTFDLDVCYEHAGANLARLAEALRDVRARPLGTEPGRPFELTADRLAQEEHFDLATDAGDFDCTDWGTDAFRALSARALSLTLEGVPVQVVALEDLVRMKRRAGRPQDRRDLAILAAVREELDRPL